MFLSSLSNRFIRPLILLFLICLFFFLPSFFSSNSILEDVCSIEDTSSCYLETPSSTYTSTELDGMKLDLNKVINNVRISIDKNVKSYNEKEYKDELGFKITYQSLKEYKDSLISIWEEYFNSPSLPSSSSNTPEIKEILSYLSFLPPRSEHIPKNIYTTSLENPNDLPEQFKSWSKMNKDWNIRFVSDNGIDEWLESVIPSSELGKQLKWLKDGDKWGVVRSDLFRYLVLLLNGGVYTDTDTACVREISRWGQNAVTHHSNNPLLDALPQILSLSEHIPTYNSADTEQEPETEKDNSPPLIIALEIDSPASGTDWKSETFVRGIQIVQWTIAAKQSHPIFLDVIGHALRKIKELREAEEKGLINDDNQNILEWSGPGAFTDAVFRYLLIRYGFHPKQVSGLDRPLRVGDVLIMPVHSFRADASEGDQGDNQVVWHGFYGRWKPGNK